jgi:hypothetical protein
LQSTIVILILSFAVFGLLLGFASSYDVAKDTLNENLQLTTDKDSYQKGQPVRFSAINHGAETLTFPDAALGLRIENLDTGETYGVIAVEVLTSIGPGESRQIEWQETETVGDGDYLASITAAEGSTQTISAEARFRIG